MANCTWRSLPNRTDWNAGTLDIPMVLRLQPCAIPRTLLFQIVTDATIIADPARDCEVRGVAGNSYPRTASNPQAGPLAMRGDCASRCGGRTRVLTRFYQSR